VVHFWVLAQLVEDMAQEITLGIAVEAGAQFVEQDRDAVGFGGR
jgi:hypothetical protein